jgi:hypothetical protein
VRLRERVTTKVAVGNAAATHMVGHVVPFVCSCHSHSIQFTIYARNEKVAEKGTLNKRETKRTRSEYKNDKSESTNKQQQVEQNGGNLESPKGNHGG